MSAAQLAQTTFTAGSTVSDDLFVNVYDGTAFSQPKEFHVNVPPNHAPVATAPDHGALSGQTISASSLFLANDADNNALTYFFYDNTPDAGSGHFTVNGTVEPANTTFAVSAAQLAQTTFTAGSTVSDDLFVNVYDGIAFSQPKEFHVVVVPPNQAPMATAPDFSAAKGQVVSASSLFLASDADNDALTYFFYDNTADAGSGHFTVNGTVEPANTTFAVSAAQLAQTTFTAGSTASDDLFVNIYDGTSFSQPKEFHVNVSPNHAPEATAPTTGAIRTSHQRIVPVPGERRRQRCADVFLLRQHAGRRQRPFHRQRYGRARPTRHFPCRRRSWRRPPSPPDRRFPTICS